MPDQVGFSPAAMCCPGIHQRDTSAGRRRIAQIEDDEDVADVPIHFRRDVAIAFVHIEAVHADAAGQMVMDEPRLRRVRHVVKAEPAVAIGLLLCRFDLDDIGLGYVQLLRNSARVGSRPSASRNALRAAGICSARRPTAVILRS